MNISDYNNIFYLISQSLGINPDYIDMLVNQTGAEGFRYVLHEDPPSVQKLYEDGRREIVTGLSQDRYEKMLSISNAYISTNKHVFGTAYIDGMLDIDPDYKPPYIDDDDSDGDDSGGEDTDPDDPDHEGDDEGRDTDPDDQDDPDQGGDDSGDDSGDDEDDSSEESPKIISNGYADYNREYRFECPICKTIFLMTSKQLSSYYDNIPTFPFAHCPNCDNTSVKGIEVTTHSKPGYI